MDVFQIEDKLKKFTLDDLQDQLTLPFVSQKETKVEYFKKEVPKFINEFWSSQQRQANSLHEISYRACFKPQLPRFFIELLTKPGEIVYDPFAGRGTTPIEAGLLDREVISNDINSLSEIFTKPRFFVPDLKEVGNRLDEIPFKEDLRAEMDLSMFFHPITEAEIVSLKEYFLRKQLQKTLDEIDLWIKMVATNRLTGHSAGFFSVYTLPPNQAASQKSQIKINQKRNQEPVYRDTKEIIMKKTQSLLRDVGNADKHNLKRRGLTAIFLNKDAANTNIIPNQSINLTVTSPPFLDIVNYTQDNWLRCWFNNINAKKIEKHITVSRSLERWNEVMTSVFKELYRITVSGGWVAFEVGEVRKGNVKLDEQIVPIGKGVGFKCVGIVINEQNFTKTSNIWGINNHSKGTNTNRIVLFQKI